MTNKNCSGCVWLLALLLVRAEIVFASLAVLGLTHNEIIIAADSRAGQSGHYQDDECKIAVLDKNTLYFATNLTRFPPELLGDGKGWSAMDAAIAASRKKPTSLDALGAAWASTMTEHLERSLRLRPVLTTSAIGADGVAITGVFARLKGTRGPTAVLVTITRAGAKFTHMTQPVSDSLTAYGDRDAWLWVRAHASRVDPANPEDVRKIVNEVIEAHVTPAVGGPVDLVVLEADKPIRWLARKSNCSTRR